MKGLNMTINGKHKFEYKIVNIFLPIGVSICYGDASLRQFFFFFRERSGSVVACLTRDRRAAGASLTGVTALWSLSKTHLT